MTDFFFELIPQIAVSYDDGLLYLNSFQKIAGRYGCTAPTSETEKLLGACQTDASEHDHCRSAGFTVECVCRRLQTLALSMCFARTYRQNNVLSDVVKNASRIVASQLLACDTSWKNVFLHVGRCVYGVGTSFATTGMRWGLPTGLSGAAAVMDACLAACVFPASDKDGMSEHCAPYTSTKRTPTRVTDWNLGCDCGYLPTSP